MKIDHLDRAAAQAVITTERLSLRPLRIEDKGQIELYGSDKRVAEMTTSIPHPLPPGATDAFVDGTLSGQRDEIVWVMDGSLSGAGAVMGLISLEPMDRNQSEIGYWVAPAFWNTGLASEAVTALIAANPLDNDTLFASVFQDNPGSARVVTNCGFEYLGDAESFSVARGATVPTWTYLKKMK